jgi:hypothetical protein
MRCDCLTNYNAQENSKKLRIKIKIPNFFCFHSSLADGAARSWEQRRFQKYLCGQFVNTSASDVMEMRGTGAREIDKLTGRPLPDLPCSRSPEFSQITKRSHTFSYGVWRNYFFCA